MQPYVPETNCECLDLRNCETGFNLQCGLPPTASSTAGDSSHLTLMRRPRPNEFHRVALSKATPRAKSREPVRPPIGQYLSQTFGFFGKFHASKKCEVDQKESDFPDQVGPGASFEDGEIGFSMNTTGLKQTLISILRVNLRVGTSRDAVLIAWLFVAVAFGFLAYVTRLQEVTHDVFHEMALFREALVRGSFPMQDLFAFTPTVNPSVHHEWGTGAILYLASVESGLGMAGIAILRLQLICALWLFLYQVARIRGAHPYAFACVAAFTFPFLWVGFATVRAQLFTLVFLSAQMWMQELDCRGRRLWVVGWWFMLVAWINIHAGFVVGLGMFGFHCIERFGAAWFRSRSLASACKATWHLMLVGCCVILALPINPYGWQYVPYLMHAITMPRPLILEWHALWHTYAPGLTLLAFGTCVLLFVYCQRFVRVTRLRGAAFLSLAFYEALQHIRHGSLCAIVWLAYVPAWLTHTPLGRSMIRTVDTNRSTFIGASQLIAAACFLFAFANQFWRPTLPPAAKYSEASFPSGAVDYLERHNFSGNLLTPFAQGAYVSWTMYPNVRVSLDGRYEVAYEDQVMLDHESLFKGKPDWPKLLEKYPCDAVLVDQNSDLRPFLEVFRKENSELPIPTKQRWRFVYEDDAFVVLTKNVMETLTYVDRRLEPLTDGVQSAFSRKYSYRTRLGKETARMRLLSSSVATAQ